jgi:hypothetical protein
MMMMMMMRMVNLIINCRPNNNKTATCPLISNEHKQALKNIVYIHYYYFFKVYL